MVTSILLLLAFVLAGLFSMNQLSKILITDKHYWVNKSGAMVVKDHNLFTRTCLICKL